MSIRNGAQRAAVWGWTSGVVLVPLAAVMAVPAVGQTPIEHHVFTLDGERGDRLGASVAVVGEGPAGDLDGDGVAELIVGAPGAVGGGGAGGRVSVLSTATGAVLYAWTGAEPNARYGAAVAGGDVDLDGVADLVVGAPFGAGGAGRVELRSGVDGGPLGAWAGAEVGARFGHAVAVVGDVDGDGTGDVAVGAPQSDATAANGGRLELRSGRDGAVLWAVGGGAFDQLGAAVAALGDVDGDGIGEVAVGIPFADGDPAAGGAFNGGAVRLLSGADGATLWQVVGPGAADQLGFAVARAGDVDGDGVDDVVAALPAADDGGIDSGAAWVLSGVDGALVATIAGEGAGQYLSAVAGVPDVDGDGLADLVVGAAGAGANDAGRVRVVGGLSGQVLGAFEGATPNGWFGAAVAGVADVGGSADVGSPAQRAVAVGAPGHDDHPELAGGLVVLSLEPRALATDEHELDIGPGGSQSYFLDAGPDFGGRPYVLLGSQWGWQPAFQIDSVTVPLVAGGSYFWLTVAGAGPVEEAHGSLDGAGRATARLDLAPNSDPLLAGLVLHHAFVVLGDLGQVVFASNAVPVGVVAAGPRD